MLNVFRFQHYSFLYVSLVVLTGACYPALLAVSSNVFGLVLFSSGLTFYELKQLVKIKIYSSVLLENVEYILYILLLLIVFVDFAKMLVSTKLGLEILSPPRFHS